MVFWWMRRSTPYITPWKRQTQTNSKSCLKMGAWKTIIILSFLRQHVNSLKFQGAKKFLPRSSFSGIFCWGKYLFRCPLLIFVFIPSAIDFYCLRIGPVIPSSLTDMDDMEKRTTGRRGVTFDVFEGSRQVDGSDIPTNHRLDVYPPWN